MIEYYKHKDSLYIEPFGEVQKKACYDNPECLASDRRFESETAFNCMTCFLGNFCPHCEENLYGHDFKVCPSCKKEIKEFKIVE